MEAVIRKAEVLIEALPYIQSFRGATIVVKMGGSAMEDPAHVEGVLADVSFMECVGMRPVIVHGGGKAISRSMRECGIEPVFVRGLRVTCERSIEVVERVLRDEVNASLVAGLREKGAAAEPLLGQRVFRVVRKTEKDRATGDVLDWGFVGEPGEVDPAPVRTLLEQNVVPVVTPLGLGPDNRLHNINADTAAAALAKALQARKLAFLSDVPGVMRDPGDDSTLVPSLTGDEAAALMKDGVIGEGMLPKVRSALDALHSGVRKVHLIDGRMPHSLLLEIFTDSGVGTEIVRA